MASAMYNGGKLGLVNGVINWASGTVLAIPVGSTFTFTATHEFVSSIAGELGAGAERATVAGKSVALDGANVRLYCDDPTFVAADFGILHGVVFALDGASDAERRLIGYTDGAGYPLTTNGGNVVIDLPGYAGTLS